MIQIIVDHGAKFLGTVKNSRAFPFDVVELNTIDRVNNSGKASVQTYGTRTNFVAYSRRDKIKASVLRHGMGKKRVARIAKNIPCCLKNTWVYECTKGVEGNGKVKRKLHLQHVPLQGTTRKDIIRNSWSSFLSNVYEMTERQRSTDWFLSCMFCFTSTTLYIAINVSEAVYYNSTELRELHEKCKEIVKINPQNKITCGNAVSIEDPDILTEKHIRKSTQSIGQLLSINQRGRKEDMGTADYWLRGNNRSKPLLQELCREKISLSHIITRDVS